MLCKKSLISACALAVSLAASSAQAIIYDVSLNTDALGLSGSDAIIVFEMRDGDFVANNSATVADFSLGGGAFISTEIIDPEVSNELSDTDDTTTIDDSPLFGFSLLAQQVTLGSSLSFSIDMTENPPPGLDIFELPDSFVFGLLDPINFDPLGFPFDADSLVDVEPFFSELFEIALLDSGPVLSNFNETTNSPISGLVVERVLRTAPLPAIEPSTVLLLSLGLIGMGAARVRRIVCR